MKVRLATVLSLTGVLVAGSAAALVNTQVLNAPANDSAADITLADTSLPGTSEPTTTDGAVTTVVDTSLPPDTTGAPATAAPAGTQAVYQIGDAGLVTLDTAGDQLTIVAAVPNAGWTVVEAKSEDALNIEVKFRSATTEVEFHATLLFGVVGTSVETKSLVPATTGSSGSTPSSGTYHDDDDDDDDHGGDHDDDDDDDHDDDDD